MSSVMVYLQDVDSDTSLFPDDGPITIAGMPKVGDTIVYKGYRLAFAGVTWPAWSEHTEHSESTGGAGWTPLPIFHVRQRSAG